MVELATAAGARRTIEFVRDNLFAVDPATYAAATVVIMATDFPLTVWPRVASVLQHLQPGTRLLTYRNLIPDVYPNAEACPFVRIAVRATFRTGWTAAFPFLLWRRRPAFAPASPKPTAALL